ncbi:hypothetical protein M758_12G088500 [Ceratodon purpureus]|nr:hypothetical protein M758_12G088500 [Ceratodon purpureus]
MTSWFRSKLAYRLSGAALALACHGHSNEAVDAGSFVSGKQLMDAVKPLSINFLRGFAAKITTLKP